jgi:hypothetical protein
MIESQNGSADHVIEQVNCRALELLEFHGDEREERYELLKDQDFWTAIEPGMPMADAFDLSEKMGQWTLDLVAKVMATGGASGGRA